MKALKKKIAFVLVVATIAICVAVPALAGSQIMAADSTWESRETGIVATVMADGMCYVAIVFGTEFDSSSKGVATVVQYTTANRYIFASTSHYSAAVYW